MSRNRVWTPELYDELHRLQAQRLSYSKIGDVLGFTRNKIAGAVHRDPWRRAADCAASP